MCCLGGQDGPVLEEVKVDASDKAGGSESVELTVPGGSSSSSGDEDGQVVLPVAEAAELAAAVVVSPPVADAPWAQERADLSVEQVAEPVEEPVVVGPPPAYVVEAAALSLDDVREVVQDVCRRETQSVLRFLKRDLLPVVQRSGEGVLALLDRECPQCVALRSDVEFSRALLDGSKQSWKELSGQVEALSVDRRAATEDVRIALRDVQESIGQLVEQLSRQHVRAVDEEPVVPLSSTTVSFVDSNPHRERRQREREAEKRRVKEGERRSHARDRETAGGGSSGSTRRVKPVSNGLADFFLGSPSSR
jgi:hypothetical protein